MRWIAELALAVSLGTVLYVYLGYPLLLLLAARLAPAKHRADENILPRVAILISAFNEREVIKEKIENSLSLDYPRDLLEIAVISDASDDGTDDIVRGFAARGVKLLRQEARLGKSVGLNLGVAMTTGEIILFSDANAIYSPDAVRKLVRHFVDPQVGYAVGNARYRESSDQKASAQSEGLYWKLETWLKAKESIWGSVVGGDGAIYAIRRELYTPLLPTDINDFLNPLQIIVQGHRGIYEPAAVCFEDAGESFEKEFQRKVRIISRSLNAVRRAPRATLPWTQPRHWFSLVSHKILRWLVPVWLIVALVSNLALYRTPFFLVLAVIQLVCYLLAFMGFLFRGRPGLIRIFRIPYYFCLVNLASLIGIFKFLSGSLSPTWQTIRQSESPAVAAKAAPPITDFAGKES
jgi:cellulose synthase/poly-beta-1,6-N-acetylglucosamine synthase-like glycosyltransferase